MSPSPASRPTRPTDNSSGRERQHSQNGSRLNTNMLCDDVHATLKYRPATSHQPADDFDSLVAVPHTPSIAIRLRVGDRIYMQSSKYMSVIQPAPQREHACTHILYVCIIYINDAVKPCARGARALRDVSTC